MKILMLTPDYYPDVYGGVGIHVTSLVRELSRIKEIDMDIIVIRCERLAENNPKIFKDSNGYTVS